MNFKIWSVKKPLLINQCKTIIHYNIVDPAHLCVFICESRILELQSYYKYLTIEVAQSPYINGNTAVVHKNGIIKSSYSWKDKNIIIICTITVKDDPLNKVKFYKCNHQNIQDKLYIAQLLVLANDFVFQKCSCTLLNYLFNTFVSRGKASQTVHFCGPDYDFTNLKHIALMKCTNNMTNSINGRSCLIKIVKWVEFKHEGWIWANLGCLTV